jgi:hypothetical protein
MSGADSQSIWDRAPFVASLWELMDRIAPVLFSGTFTSLFRAEWALRHQWRVSANELDTIRSVTLTATKALCETAGLIESAKACDRALSVFSAPKNKKLPFELAERIQILRESIQSELNHRLVLVVKNGREIYWQHHALFGQSVLDAFYSARFDIVEAGNCWVTGRNNAVIYHLMMATEVGLRCLAEDRRVIITQRNKQIPIEFAQWGEIIRELSKKIEEIRQWPDKEKKASAQQFYHPLLLSLNGFCEGYRNHLFHGRGIKYGDPETQSLMSHVNDFLARLSQRVGENKITPEVW